MNGHPSAKNNGANQLSNTNNRQQQPQALFPNKNNQERRPLLPHKTSSEVSSSHNNNNNNNNSNNHNNNTEYWDDTESEVERRTACRGMTTIAILLFTILVTLNSTSWFFRTSDTASTTPTYSGDNHKMCPETIPFCYLHDANPNDDTNKNHKLHHHDPTLIHVPLHRKGFPSFWEYAPHGPMNVSYDGRSFLINQQRVLLLSGSMHPIRSTQQTWEHALDQAVHNGLNMITIYVFWAEHQRFSNQAMDWTLMAGHGVGCDDNDVARPSHKRPFYCGWSLADAVRAAAERGLFVHARIGPYVCAEYNYGGIPEWVPLHSPNMEMRRLNKEWLDAMEAYVTSTIEYLTDNKLFAYQGGPILMAQIENELGEENEDDTGIPIMIVNNNDVSKSSSSGSMPTTMDDSGSDSDDDYVRDLRQLSSDSSTGDNGKQDNGDDSAVVDTTTTTTTTKPSVQDYADWCGSLVERLAPNVVWTMCNGLSADNTIITCNGDCSTTWLEQHGSTGRIQVDQPAMWSEDEGGFQVWGDTSSHPSSYFWGLPARSMAYDALRWFARGGTHLNYYMWWGGYNRGRASGSGIMNAYATDAPMCSSGERHEPKWSHFRELHLTIQHAATILLAAPTALNQQIDVEYMNKNDEWEISGQQRMFVYRTNHTRKENEEVVFVENDAKDAVVVRIKLGILREENMIVNMNPQSAMIIKDGSIKFDSSAINAANMAYERKFEPNPVSFLGWSSCAEAIGASIDKTRIVVQPRPVEQTALNIDRGVSSDFAWYETSFELDESMDEASILVESQKASAMVLFIDGTFMGEAYNRNHAEGNETFTFPVGRLDLGTHVLAILSESLGYHNLIGRWRANTKAKVKGITGDVVLVSETRNNKSLVSKESEWRSSPGLNGAENGFCRDVMSAAQTARSPRPHWSTAMFNTPTYDPATQALFLNITTGRGHWWLNGHNMGRWWNITRGGTSEYSQQYYFLPYDFLESNGSVNKIVFFDVLGGDLSSTQLVLSWLERTDTSNFQDEVDFPMACI